MQPGVAIEYGKNRRYGGRGDIVGNTPSVRSGGVEGDGGVRGGRYRRKRIRDLVRCKVTRVGYKVLEVREEEVYRVVSWRATGVEGVGRLGRGS